MTYVSNSCVGRMSSVPGRLMLIGVTTRVHDPVYFTRFFLDFPVKSSIEAFQRHLFQDLICKI